MSELDERDWELLNAYHDGELTDADSQEMRARLRREPALRAGLEAVQSVSSGLGALRPDTAEVVPFVPVIDMARSSRPRWLMCAVAAALASCAVFFGGRLLEQPTLFDLHVDLANSAQPGFAVTSDNMGHVPDLSSANLTPVAQEPVATGSVAHYVGPNGCRLSYFYNVAATPAGTPPQGAQVSVWETSGPLVHMVIATGMDQGKFDAIAAHLKRVTRNPDVAPLLATLSQATKAALPCVG